MKSDDAAKIGKHKFELAGLGKAPFKFIGINENKFTLPDGTSRAGGSCDYCGTGILFEFIILSYDGKQSKVGCNCIEKIGDKGLISAYKTSPEFRKMKREKFQTRGRDAKAKLIELIEHHANALNALPHPQNFINRQTGQKLTMLDHAKWMLNHCGVSGTISTLNFIKKQLEAKIVDISR